MTSKKENATPAWVKNMRALMDQHGFNPRSLSLRAGLNATAVRDMIEGRSRFPRYDTVLALADALQTTPAMLMSGDDTAADGHNNGDAFGRDVELLTEIITRLQETAAEMGRDLTPREFAAMSATIYRRLHEAGDMPSRKTRIAAISPQIHDLLEYEGLRGKKHKAK
ncbi:MAG: helix-turn-helix transcriptional regulator [Alphaproteobacteria bacterium]|nr:helix-turn-helix transcriptional regulator [Alphaproteobacteria bacterium]